MPRKLRNSKTRHHAIDVSAALFHFLVWGDFEAAAALTVPGASKWELFEASGTDTHQKAWAAIVEDALAAWTRVYPGTRPRNWWQWSAPELRRVHGRFQTVRGRWRCQDSGVPYGAPEDWDDRPMVESVPAYLDRLGLWLEGERARVPSAAFDPQPFAWHLTTDDASDDGPADDDA